VHLRSLKERKIMPNQDPYPTYPTGAGATSSPDRPGGATAQGLKDRVTDATSQAKEKANEFGRTAVQKMDEGRRSARRRGAPKHRRFTA
jgi:hypothetical protein